MKKVLLIYATAGIGHVKAALAIKDAIRNKEGLSYEIVDILDYTNALLKWAYRRLYIILVKYIPAVWAMLYYSLDMPWVYNRIRGFRTRINRLNTKKFAHYLYTLKPDVIVSTHFFPSEVISFLKKKGVINSYLISVITDFKLHSYWVSKEIDLFVVADTTLKQELQRAGVDEQKIKVLGIPIESKFYELLNIQKDRFTVLIASGGFGVGPVEEMVNELMSVDIPIQLLVVCGKNPVLYEKLRRLQKASGIPIKVYGFVDNMHELMGAADLLISKSGGMTASEALAKDLPMIIVYPIPGQEMRNCAFLVENGVAIREDTPSGIKEKVINFFNHREKLEAMRENIRAIKKPNPALNLVNLIEEICTS